MGPVEIVSQAPFHVGYHVVRLNVNTLLSEL
jgi:hypothetical protein